MTLNYAFIAMVIKAYCNLPVAKYKVRNNGERGQLLAVQMSQLTVVTLLTYKAAMNSHTKPKQTYTANIFQLTTDRKYGCQF
jgi:hypothetical protein